MKPNQIPAERLANQARELERRYQELVDRRYQLDLTRGRLSEEQLELSRGLEGIIQGRYRLNDGMDVRNYGRVDGIPEAKALGAELLGVSPNEVLVGGNSSLAMMYQFISAAYYKGVAGVGSAWSKEPGTVKFLCPVPGYDRHFGICQELGIEMLPVPLRADGPDMDLVEDFVKREPLIKGMWCVPKYSNPTGHVYSDEVVARIARLGKIAGPHFRVIWDNAYAVHDFGDRPRDLKNIVDLCRAFGTWDNVVVWTSTSKITFAGAGIAFMAASPANQDHFLRRLNVISVGPDKVNQWRHVLFLKDLATIQAHMARHARILRPKFECVLHQLEAGLGQRDIGEWTLPEGGYFVSFDSLPGLAAEIVRLAAGAGVKLTPAGSTFPLGQDPEDRNIRIAPSSVDLGNLERAMEVFVVCVQLASMRQRLGGGA